MSISFLTTLSRTFDVQVSHKEITTLNDLGKLGSMTALSSLSSAESPSDF